MLQLPRFLSAAYFLELRVGSRSRIADIGLRKEEQRGSVAVIGRWGAFVLSGLLFALVAGSCAAPPLTVDEYVVEMEAVTNDYIAESQALSIAFHSSVESEVSSIVDQNFADARERATQVTVREMMLYFVLLEDAMGRYLERAGAIEPPAELDEHHSSYLDAVTSVFRSLPATRSLVEVAGDLDEIAAAIAGSGFQDGQIRWTTMCLRLESAVRGEGVGIDLGCTRPSSTQL